MNVKLTKRKHEPSWYDGWIKSKRRRIQQSSYIVGELEKYFALGPKAADNPIQWWMDHRTEYPRLPRLALDILAIPPMAADCERAFSLAKLAMTSQRQSIEPETLEMLQCLKNWLRLGLIRLGNGLINPRQQNGDEIFKK